MIDPRVLVLPSWYPSRIAPVRGIFFREQAKMLRATGVDLGVAYPDLRRLRTVGAARWLCHRFQTTAEIEEGVPTVRVHGWNVPSSRLRKHLFLALAGKAFKRYTASFECPQLLHAQGVLWGGVTAGHIGETHDLPYVVTAHSSAFGRGLLAPWQEREVSDVLANAQHVLAVSEALARELRGYAPDRTIRVVPNVVDTEFFCLPPGPRDDPPFTFLVVATLRANKRVGLVIRAFYDAFGTDSEDRLVVVGDGRDRADLEKLAGSLGIEAQVRFTGRLSRVGVRREMWDANVLVLASKVETFGMVVGEAMATGLPVVVTRSGGPPEIVPEFASWLVEPDRMEEMSRALATARQEEPGLRTRVSEVREHIVSRFGKQEVLPRIVALYRSALGSGGSVG